MRAWFQSNWKPPKRVLGGLIPEDNRGTLGCPESVRSEFQGGPIASAHKVLRIMPPSQYNMTMGRSRSVEGGSYFLKEI